MVFYSIVFGSRVNPTGGIMCGYRTRGIHRTDIMLYNEDPISRLYHNCVSDMLLGFVSYEILVLHWPM